MRLATIIPTLILATALQAQAPQQGWSITQGGYAPWQADDKRAHFQAGLLPGLVFYGVYASMLKLKHPWLWTLATGLAIGLAKEAWDRHHHGTPELMDALNTAAGFAMGGSGSAVLIRIRF